MDTQQRSDQAVATSPNRVYASGDSEKFSDIGLHSEPEDGDFEFIQHTDAPYSSYNSHADSKWKYKEAIDEVQSEKTRTPEAHDGFVEVEKEKTFTSSRNGAADRPEKYK